MYEIDEISVGFWIRMKFIEETQAVHGYFLHLWNLVSVLWRKFR
jgi:hypothetical protein